MSLFGGAKVLRGYVVIMGVFLGYCYGVFLLFGDGWVLFYKCSKGAYYQHWVLTLCGEAFTLFSLSVDCGFVLQFGVCGAQELIVSSWSPSMLFCKEGIRGLLYDMLYGFLFWCFGGECSSLV